MSQRKALIKNVSTYALSVYSAQILDIVNGVLTRRFLGATNMGIWSFLQMFLAYASHASLGVTSATIRDVPYHRAKGENERAEEVKNLVFTFTFFTAFLVAMGMVLFAFFYRRHTSTPLFAGLLVIATLIMLQRIYNQFVTLLRAYKEFVFAGYLNLVSSVSSIVLTIALTYRFKLYGFFAGLILNFLLSIGLILWFTPHRFKLYFSWLKLRPLVHFGVAMLVFDILRSTLLNIDRMMVTKFLGFHELGIYSVALMVNNFVYNFPTLIVAIFPPYFQEAYGKRDRVEDLKKILFIPTVSLSYILSLLIGCMWIIVPWLIHAVLPDYVSGIPALRLLVVGSFFLALTHSLTTFVVTIRKHMVLIPITLCSIGLGFGLNTFFLKLGWGLVGAAIGTGILYSVHFLALALFSFKHLYSWKGIVKTMIRILSPFAYVFGAIALVYFLIPGGELSLRKVIVHGVVFALLSIPLLFLAERETRLFSSAREALFT